MNIIYDHRPELFLNNVSLFVKQLGRSKRIDLFLSKLSEDDVSQTLYRDTLANRTGPDSSRENGSSWVTNVAKKSQSRSEKSKINSICDVLLTALRTNTSDNLQNVITAYVCKRPPDLVSALELTASLRRKNPEKAEAAISHLCFLTDVNELYDTSLALYDLPLALLVAQQAQRDPREYVPFLQNLNSLPIDRCKFQIDDHLAHREKALVSLHTLAAHEEAEVYTKKYVLYSEALKLYRYDSDRLQRIVRFQASYFSSQSDHLASAMASESISDYVAASESYAKFSPPRWREALHCISMIDPPMPLAKRNSLALQLANTLSEEQRDYRAASQIHVEYLRDVALGARLLCKGSYFSEALRLLSQHQLQSQISDVIDIALAEKTGEITELVANLRSQLSAQMPRIAELKTKRGEDPLAYFGGDSNAQDGEADVPDNVSLAPTNASTLGGQSLFTRYGNKSNFAGTVASAASRKTSKTRRKEERKRAMGKKGSIYEEEYLVGSVKRLIERFNSVRDEVRRLLEGLTRRGMRERVEAVDQVMELVTTECEAAVDEVWEDTEAKRMAAVHPAAQALDSNWPPNNPLDGGDVLSLPESQSMMHAPPKVKPWKGPMG